MIDTHIIGVGHLICDPTRAVMLTALKNDRSLSSTELARIAGVAPSTSSGHLAKLVQGRLATFEAVGRHRYYRLARPEVADVIEALEALAAAAGRPDRLQPPGNRALRCARVCYDHLAGALGVQITGSLVSLGYLKVRDGDFAVSRKGEMRFVDLGIDMESLRERPRRLTRKCSDWSEQRPHLGGALGAALLERFCVLKWLRRHKASQAIALTPLGRREVDRLCNAGDRAAGI